VLQSLIKHCRADYNWQDDDTKDYLPMWKLPGKGTVGILAIMGRLQVLGTYFVALAHVNGLKTNHKVTYSTLLLNV
jgi:hypothetical protein